MRIIHITPILAIVAVLAGNANAASQQSSPSAEGGSNAPVCMTRGLGVEGGEQTIAIIATLSDVAALRAKGFGVTDCARAFRSGSAQLAWRERACSIASIRNKRLQDRMERQLGERPAVLCGMAERALGQWGGGKR